MRCHLTQLWNKAHEVQRDGWLSVHVCSTGPAMQVTPERIGLGSSKTGTVHQAARSAACGWWWNGSVTSPTWTLECDRRTMPACRTRNESSCRRCWTTSTAASCPRSPRRAASLRRRWRPCGTTASTVSASSHLLSCTGQNGVWLCPYARVQPETCALW